MSEAPDIATLFATDPLKLTKSDRTSIIVYMRENRDKFIKAGQPSRMPKEPKQKSKGPLPDIDLGDLDL